VSSIHSDLRRSSPGRRGALVAAALMSSRRPAPWRRSPAGGPTGSQVRDPGRRGQRRDKAPVDGQDFLVRGMNWDYIPIGQNYSWSLWAQPHAVIEAALAREMPLLRSMGVNAIRQYAGIPPRWVRYIYERYGIYTVLNHTVGRYGFTLDGVWHPSVDYSDPRMRAALKGRGARAG